MGQDDCFGASFKGLQNFILSIELDFFSLFMNRVGSNKEVRRMELCIEGSNKEERKKNPGVCETSLSPPGSPLHPTPLAIATAPRTLGGAPGLGVVHVSRIVACTKERYVRPFFIGSRDAVDELPRFRTFWP